VAGKQGWVSKKGSTLNAQRLKRSTFCVRIKIIIILSYATFYDEFFYLLAE
jgi:hypothetical protein